MLVYDITRKETFSYVTKLLKEIKYNRIAIILVGNKNDLENKREVSYEEGEVLAKENDLIFLETSAKTLYNVDEIFKKLTSFILNNIKKTLAVPPEIFNVKLEKKKLILKLN